MDLSSKGVVCPQPGHVEKRKTIAGECPACKKKMVREVGGSATCSIQCQEKMRYTKKKKKIEFYKSKQKKRPLSRKIKRARKEAERVQRLYGSNFYTSVEWRMVRYAVFKLRGRKCEICGRNPKKDKISLHVDHIRPRSKYPALALAVDNLQVLCEDCNMGKSNKDDTDWR